MKNRCYAEILDRSFSLLANLKAAQFVESPTNIQIDWLEKAWTELFARLIKVNCPHGRVALHWALGSVLAIGGETGLQEALVSKIESRNKAKHSVNCHKTLKAYLYLKNLADRLKMTEEEFLRGRKKIYLGALYILGSAPESETLTSEVLDYLRHDFWLTKPTAEGLVKTYAPKANLIGSEFWVKKSRSIYKWTNPHERFGEKIRYLRSECNLSQSQLAERLGLSAISIFHLEKGDRKLDAIELWLISKEFATRSQEFKELSECLDKLLGGRSGEKLYLGKSRVSQAQFDAIELYFLGNDSRLELRSAVRQAIWLIAFGDSCSKSSRIKANAKCGIEPYKNLGGKIKALRIQNGISRSHLSKQCGISWVSVFHLERGDRRVDVGELQAISKAIVGNSSEFLVLSKCLDKMFEK